MSFTFGNASSAGQSNNATTSSAPASGSLFGSAPAASSTPPSTGGGLFGGKPASSGFSFGNAGSGTNNSTTPASGTPGSLFGNTAAKPADSKPSLFGAPASGASTPSATTGGGLFGSGSSSNTNTQPAAGGSLFGAAAKPAATGGLFGNTSSTPASTAPASTPPAAAASSSGGLFGNKDSKTPAAGTTPTSQPGGSLFGNAPASGTGTSSLFGTTPTTNPATTATPAKPMFGGMNSTTPAGAPATGNLFGGAAAGDKKENKTGGGLFSGLGAAPAQNTSAQPASSGAAPSTLFGSTPKAAAPSSTPFGGPKPAETAPATSSSLFGKPAAAQSSTPTSSIFPGGNAQSSQPAASAAKPAGSLFGGAPAATAGASSAASTPAATATATATAPPPAGSLFGGMNKPAASTATSEATKTPSLFGAAPAAAAAPASSAPASEAPKAAGGLFGQAASTPASSAPATAAPAASTAPATGSILGQNKPAEAAKTNASANANLGASTTGPTSQIARLKNKTMDEIITRWATDLSKYQKEFKEQAAQVAAWDRLLVDNGEKIQKLYLSTYEAEKASRDVERQLVAVESQQEELESWLDKYEAEVDSMFNRDIGRNEQLGGPDQEREKTYKLAEKLTDRLDEMGRDLSKMIKEINDISGSLSNGNKPDDPLSQIVRVLNGHLSQLQWIDTNAATLTAKVNAAQKASATIGNQYGGNEPDAAESFYRSYIGRR